MPRPIRPAAHYRADTCFAEPSVGLLMKRIAGSIVAHVDQRLDVHGLTSAQWGPLLRLRNVGPSTVVELARWQQVDPGAMTRLLDRLEKKQLCKRVRSSTDRRVVQVQLTPAGETAIAQVPEVLVTVLNAHLAGFSRAEWTTLKILLQRMDANAESLRGQV